MGPTAWRVSTTTDVLATAGAYVDPASLLSPAEQERHARLRQRVDQDDFVAARVLARVLVLERDGTSAGVASLRRVGFQQVCRTCGGAHGRPRVVGREDVHVSWAHAKGVVAAAASGRPVGVDVERTGQEPPPGSSGDGIEQWLVWSRAEAITKLGLADLETALAWRPAFDHPPSPETAVTVPGGRTVRLTDAVRTDLGVVCALAR